MQTEIGRNSRGTRLRRAAAVGTIAVALDLALVRWGRLPQNVDGRWALVVASLVAQAWLAGGDLPTLGLCGPSDSWWRWAKNAALIGLVIAACLRLSVSLWVITGPRLPITAIPPEDIVPAFSRMCIFAPLLEEPNHRVAVCVPLTGLAGLRWATIASGATFGLLHVAYGNPTPENLLGG